MLGNDFAPAFVEEIVLISNNEAVVDARCSIGEIKATFDVDLPQDDYETIGGLVAGEMGHIPQSGEVLQLGAVEIVVEQSTTQQIERVRIIRHRAGPRACASGWRRSPRCRGPR